MSSPNVVDDIVFFHFFRVVLTFFGEAGVRRISTRVSIRDSSTDIRGLAAVSDSSIFEPKK